MLKLAKHGRYMLAAIGLILCCIWGLGCGKRQTYEAGAEPVDPVYGHLLRPLTNLPVVTLKIDGVELRAEVARSPVEIATGMMFRTNVPEGSGMLFVFREPATRSFYMRNCFVPLSIAFIAPDGTILEIADMEPGDMGGVTSHSSNVQFCLEVPRGWFARHGIRPGAIVTTPNGSLQKVLVAP